MKTIIITAPETLAVSFWRTNTMERQAMGDEDPIAGISIRPGDGLVTWDWRGKSGAKLFNVER